MKVIETVVILVYKQGHLVLDVYLSNSFITCS